MCLVVSIPSPSSPCELFPQHMTRPGEARAQMCRSPAEMEMKLESMPQTGAADVLCWPWPGVIFRNAHVFQHAAPPLAVRAQELSLPAEIATAGESSPAICTGGVSMQIERAELP